MVDPRPAETLTPEEAQTVVRICRESRAHWRRDRQFSVCLFCHGRTPVVHPYRGAEGAIKHKPECLWERLRRLAGEDV